MDIRRTAKLYFWLLGVMWLSVLGCSENRFLPLPVQSGGFKFAVGDKSYCTLYMLVGSESQQKVSPIVISEDDANASQFSPAVFQITNDRFGVTSRDQINKTDSSIYGEYKAGDVVFFDRKSGAMEHLGGGVGLDDLRKHRIGGIKELLLKRSGGK